MGYGDLQLAGAQWRGKHYLPNPTSPIPTHEELPGAIAFVHVPDLLSVLDGEETIGVEVQQEVVAVRDSSISLRVREIAIRGDN